MCRFAVTKHGRVEKLPVKYSSWFPQCIDAIYETNIGSAVRAGEEMATELDSRAHRPSTICRWIQGPKDKPLLQDTVSIVLSSCGRMLQLGRPTTSHSHRGSVILVCDRVLTKTHPRRS